MRIHLCSRGLDIYQFDGYYLVDQIGNRVQLDSVSGDHLFEQFNVRLIEDESGIEELRDLIRKIFYELDESLGKFFRLSIFIAKCDI